MALPAVRAIKVVGHEIARAALGALFPQPRDLAVTRNLVILEDCGRGGDGGVGGGGGGARVSTTARSAVVTR